MDRLRTTIEELRWPPVNGVVTTERLQRVILLALRTTGRPMTPSDIRIWGMKKRVLPYRHDLTGRIYDLINHSFHAGESVFYLERGKQRRFGLCEWRASEEKEMVWRELSALSSFTTKQFYALVEDVLGPERRSMAYTLLGQFMEEGRIHRVTTGLYRLTRQPPSQEQQDS